MTDEFADDLAVPSDQRPSPERTARMDQALARVMADLAAANPSISVSPLGPGWSSDLDVYVSDRQTAVRSASSAGWVELQHILSHLGYPDQCSYAITDEGTILAKADISVGQAGSSSQRAVARADRLPYPDLRAVLEIRKLAESGLDLSTVDPQLIEKLANAEAALGGSVLGDYRSTDLEPHGLSSEKGSSRIRRPQVRLAISGVDGSGKSTLTTGLAQALDRCGIPTTTIWTRPGMGLERLDRLARKVRKLRKDDVTGIRRLAEGQATETISSRKGITGWVWLCLITFAYLAGIRGQTRRASGVVIYDRHLLDALATVDAIYEGVPSDLQRRLIRWMIPKADLSVWLDLDPELASARKPDDLIGADLVAKQAVAYRRYASLVSGLRRHDGSADSYLSSSEVIGELNAALSGRRRGLRTFAFTALRRR
ncbi:MAG: hypothetical protein JJE47_17775 [Acidimicrobiia bacterium]|nr:hypothetical protein [Acidimicrobiia bacterium]